MKTTNLVNREEGKYYNMQQQDDRVFTSTWGRQGDAETISADHDMSDWDSVLATKKKMGYVPAEVAVSEGIITDFKRFSSLRESQDALEFGEEDGDFNIANRVIAAQQEILDAE